MRQGHTVRLTVAQEPLSVHSVLALLYPMAEALEIPQILDRQVHVNVQEAGYPESDHLLALTTKAFVAEESLTDLEATVPGVYRPQARHWAEEDS